MGWLISVGRARRERGMNAGVTTSQCIVTSNPCHTAAHWSFTPNADRNTFGEAGSKPAWQSSRVWQNVLATLVGND